MDELLGAVVPATCRITMLGKLHTSNVAARERGGSAAFSNRHAARYWRLTAHQAANRWRNANAGRTLADNPVVVAFTVHRPTNRQADADNAQPTGKAIRDGFVDAGLLSDDHDKCVLHTSYARGDNRDYAITAELFEFTAEAWRMVHVFAHLATAASSTLAWPTRGLGPMDKR